MGILISQNLEQYIKTHLIYEMTSINEMEFELSF